MLKSKILKAAALSGALFFAILGTGCGAGGSDTIKIGGDLELTGNNASYGTSTANGAQLAFDEINTAGGIDGKKIEFIKADNKSEPAEAANAITKLISSDKVSVILGACTSSNTMAITQIANDSKIPLVSSFSTNAKVTVSDDGKVNPYVYRVCFIDPFQGTVMGNFATNTLKVKKVAVYIDNSSDYSKGLAHFFEEGFTKNGGQIVAEEAYLQKDSDFKATLTKIAATNPDMIYVPGYYEEVGKIIKQARDLGITVPITGGDGWDSSKLVDIAGADALNNTYFTNHYSVQNKTPEADKFITAYKDKYKQDPDAAAVLGYDAATMIIDAIKRAGSADPEKINTALAATKDLQLVSGKITIDKDHNPVKQAVIIEFKDGKQTFKQAISPE
ncbi:ABC transporter substrate-binding protein [Pectinatus haikarae]|uniref:Branched-chain amino acid transport system substrate-binding protein n=1 Tax=Pectinatus haikarae TaxID=349096 RepID=A0ABT9Y823_9FIRM|nr:ABC transporter substrate-binding protein [Pectinatus haikarae]MDQ0203993.1 branched-chain amino acid transport system substrate-binding protein [Pectinatus haikarae]